MAVQRARLSGDRLHLQHGPIDLVIGAEGQREAAFAAAEARLGSVLAELMEEIDLLRMTGGTAPKGAIARKMWEAVQPLTGFVTPMAAVAGSVAETVLEAMVGAADLQRAYVNNGGDIALHLQGDARFRVAMAGLRGDPLGKITLDAQSGLRGIATSGQGGRSLSFGIADSVTVLARCAAEADVAATLIAGAVDLPGHTAIRRAPARSVRDDSDLGERDVVVHVGALSAAECDAALKRGAKLASQMQAKGLIAAASLHLRGQSCQVDMEQEKGLIDA